MNRLAIPLVAFVFFLAGVGADAAATKLAAWWCLRRERRRHARWLAESTRRECEQRVKGVMSAAALLDLPGSKLAQAVAREQATPFVVEIPEHMPTERTVYIMRRIMCELRAQDRRRYFPGDSGEEN